MIVVDVNVIAYLWIPGELTTAAEAVLNKDAQWAAPVLWRSEFQNILAGYMRTGRMGRAEVDRCLVAAESHMRDCEFQIPSGWVMDRVSRSNCSAYDCEYVALAEDLNVMLVTADKQIVREFSGVAVELKSFQEK